MYKGTELLPMSFGDSTGSNTKRTVERGVKFGEYTTALLTAGKAHEMLLFDGRMIHDSVLPNQKLKSNWQRHVYFIAATNDVKVTVGTF